MSTPKTFASVRVPFVRQPDDGIVRINTGFKVAYGAIYRVNGKEKRHRLDAANDEEARLERDKFHLTLIANGARRFTKKKRKARVATGRWTGEPYIQIHVEIEGVRVGSFASVEDARDARDAYVAQHPRLQAKLARMKWLQKLRAV